MRPRLIALAVLILMALSATGPRGGVRMLASVASTAPAPVASSGFGDAASAAHETHLSAALATPASLVASPWQHLEFHARLILATTAPAPAEFALIALDRSTAHPHAPPHLLNDSLRI